MAESTTAGRPRDARPRKPAVRDPPPSAMLEPPSRAERAKGGAALDPRLPALPIEAALREISTVPAVDLHRTAACVWAARAVACYRVCLGKSDLQEGLSYLYLGEHYREAALAHAALGEAWRPLYDEVEALMDEDRAAAARALQARPKAGLGVQP